MRMKILHVVPGLNEPTNGIAVAAKWIAEGQKQGGDEVEVVETREFVSSTFNLNFYDEVWVHSMWLPMTMKACRRVLRAGRRTTDNLQPSTFNLQPRLVRMLHGCLDPVKLRYSWYKKILVAGYELWLMKHSDRIVATEEDEAKWIGYWHTGAKIQMLDLGSTVRYVPRAGLGKRNFLFVGRMHPLKGFDVLMKAVERVRASDADSDFTLTVIGKDEKSLRAGFEAEANAKGLPIRFLGEVSEEVKRKEMMQADCLVLPTLSENFALVVKESLEFGVPVITTDGAKIWEGHDGVDYLDGFVRATEERRVEMLVAAIGRIMV